MTLNEQRVTDGIDKVVTGQHAYNISASKQKYRGVKTVFVSADRPYYFKSGLPIPSRVPDDVRQQVEKLFPVSDGYRISYEYDTL